MELERDDSQVRPLSFSDTRAVVKGIIRKKGDRGDILPLIREMVDITYRSEGNRIFGGILLRIRSASSGRWISKSFERKPEMGVLTSFDNSESRFQRSLGRRGLKGTRRSASNFRQLGMQRRANK